MEENVVKNEQEGQVKDEGTKSTDIDYTKLEEIINKGLQVKENGILKSYFSQQGLTEDEVKEAVETYKTNKANKEKEKIGNSPELAELKQQIETLKSEKAKQELDNAIQLTAMGMGLNEKGINALLKIQDFSNVIDGDKVSKEKIQENIDNFLNDYEMFKPKSQGGGFKVSVGPDKETLKQETEEDAMRAAIGLKPKK